MSHLVPWNTIDKPSSSTVEMYSKPFSPKDKMQIWEVKSGKRSEQSGHMGYHMENFGHQGLCLGSSNSIKSKSFIDGRDSLFSQLKCDNSSKVLWYLEPIWEQKGGMKCFHD